MPLMLHQRAQERLLALEAEQGWNPAKLLSELEGLLASYPDFSPAYDSMAVVFEEENRGAEALRCRLAAIARNPYSADLWTKLGILHYRKLQQPREAFQALKQAMKIDAHHPAALALLAEIEHSRNPATAAGR